MYNIVQSECTYILLGVFHNSATFLEMNVVLFTSLHLFDIFDIDLLLCRLHAVLFQIKKNKSILLLALLFILACV